MHEAGKRLQGNHEMCLPHKYHECFTAAAAMNRACDGYLRDTARDRKAALALWPPSSLQSLLFALNRVR